LVDSIGEISMCGQKAFAFAFYLFDSAFAGFFIDP